MRRPLLFAVIRLARVQAEATSTARHDPYLICKHRTDPTGLPETSNPLPQLWPFFLVTVFA